MKKFLKLIISAVIISSMVATFAACGAGDDAKEAEAKASSRVSDFEKEVNDLVNDINSKTEASTTTTAASADSEQGIIGVWRSRANYSEFLNSAYDAMGLGEYLNTSDLPIDIVLEFFEDGRCVMTADEESIKEAFDDYVSTTMKQGLRNYLEETANAAGMSLEQALEASGYDSFDELYEQTVENMDLEDTLSEMLSSTTFYYTLEDGDLTFYNDSAKTQEDTQIIADYDGSSIVLSLSESANSTVSSMLGGLLPLTFRKD